MKFTLETSNQILKVEVSDVLHQADFDSLTQTLSVYFQTHSTLQGLLLHAEHFPRWENLAALQAHLRFIHAHHQKIRKVAIVTDALLGELAEHLATFFVSAELRHFAFKAEDEALVWLKMPRL